ncbi:helix-turn-helix domain-containing protein [Roseomonas populi]|uniref:Helix-turn-helix domain-containing protein n=1 Tax=Roseomonas populi TaxID=3121582 RepID=A0ABT1WZS6_9PROT|nr:helix-turn-helix domain-containing protein [Roseomonas pecuniae]MCR0980628.1 helix-turn-helix domain-containing protein [Roseomonas pecuniae]
MNHQPAKLAFTIPEAVTSSGIGRTKLYALIREGQLEARKLGSRTLIPAPSLQALMDSLPRLTKTAA